MFSYSYQIQKIVSDINALKSHFLILHGFLFLKYKCNKIDIKLSIQFVTAKYIG